VIIEYMMALLDKPQRLLKYDMIGNRLDEVIDPTSRRASDKSWGAFPFKGAHGEKLSDDTRALFRSFIAKVGAEEGWTTAVNSKHRDPVKFDEPTLGIVGMWRLGGGAHPHFALALGETMLRVGQRYIAWCAYERAAQLAGIVWPDEQLQQQFAVHCRGRQAVIEEQLPAEERERLRPAFDADLDRGQRYQQAYQRYEEQRIAEGASLDDPHFYDAFHATHEAIASPVGSEDQFVVEEKWLNPFTGDRVPPMLLFAGLFALAAGCVLRKWPFRMDD
jgi:hypothetical protein